MGSLVRGAGSLRRSGEFYSTVIAQARVGELLLAELRQPGGRDLPRHEHERGYVTLVVGGDYAEATSIGSEELPPFSAIFNPPGLAHTGRVGPAGTRLFIVEAGPCWNAELGLRFPGSPVVDAGAGALLWPALAMFLSWKSGTSDPLLLEAHALEMFGALGGWTAVPGTTPAWWSRVRDRLHAQFRGSLRIRDLAREAGVHPVHLARVFRARERCTPGQYVQRLRVRAACALLRDRETPLAGIAAECGFFDQSHFTRTFQRFVGVPPGRFREAVLGLRAVSSARGRE